MRDLEFIDNEKIELLYDISAGIMSVIAVIVVIVEFSNRLTLNELKSIKIIDNVIYLIFLTDYLLRLILAKNKKVFFLNNLIDLIAILPFQFLDYIEFGSVFKLIRVGTYILRLFGDITEILFTNGLIYVICVVVVIILIGAIGIYVFESSINKGIQSYGDALWVSIVTVTSVGYGDVAVLTTGGRVIACILMFTGLIFLGIVTSAISTFYLSRVDKKILTNFEHNKKVEDLNYLSISDLSLKDKKLLVDYYNYLKDNEK